MPDTSPRAYCTCKHIQAAHYGQSISRTPGHCTICDCNCFVEVEELREKVSLLETLQTSFAKAENNNEVLSEKNLLLQNRNLQEKLALAELQASRDQNVIHEISQELKAAQNKCKQLNDAIFGISPNVTLNAETSTAQAIAWTHKMVSEMTFEEIEDLVIRLTATIGVAKSLQSQKTATVKIKEKDLKGVQKAKEVRETEPTTAGRKADSPYEKIYKKLVDGALKNKMPRDKAESQARSICDATLANFTSEADRNKFLGRKA